MNPAPLRAPGERPAEAFDCTSCGACCVEAGRVDIHTWDDVPDEFVVTPPLDVRHMRRETFGRRCGALCGTVGVEVRCGIYAQRPEVCRDFAPAGEGCRAARQTMAEWRARLHHKPWGYDDRPLDGPQPPDEPRWMVPGVGLVGIGASAPAADREGRG